VTFPHSSSTSRSPGTLPAARPILVIDSGPDARLRSVRPVLDAGLECVSAPSLEAGALEAATQEPLFVLIDWRAVPLGSLDPFVMLRKALTSELTPLVLVASKETPNELLELCARSGITDCILGPLRLAHVQARATALLERERNVGAKSGRGRRRGLLMVGPSSPYRTRLGTFLELSGFRLSYANSVDDALRSWHQAQHAVDLLVICGRATGGLTQAAADTLRSTEAHALPSIVIADSWAQTNDTLDAMAVQNLSIVGWFTQDSPLMSVLRKVDQQLRQPDLHLRADERVPFYCLVEVREAIETGRWTSGFSHDLSPGGIFLKTLVPLRSGAAVELRIHLALTREIIEGTGVVAWSNSFRDGDLFSYPVGMGLQFLGMSPNRLGRLRSICEAQSELGDGSWS
jgi:uncharacterized protein (TIGR02266 family)